MLRRPLIRGSVMVGGSGAIWGRVAQFIADSTARQAARRSVLHPSPALPLVAFATGTAQIRKLRTGLNPAKTAAKANTAGKNRPLKERLRKPMPEKFVAKASEFPDGDRRIVFVGDNEIGVFKHGGQ